MQFGEFIHLAVSSAFGGTPPGIEAASPVARMLLVGELLSGATVLGAYLASIWGAPTIRPDAVSGHPVSPDEEPDSVALVKQMVKAWNRGDKDQVFGGLSEGFDVRDADGTVLASGRDAAKDLLETSGINVVRISVPAQENADREVRIVVTAAAAGSDARATVARVAVIDGKPVGIQLGAPDKGDARRAVADDGGH